MSQQLTEAGRSGVYSVINKQRPTSCWKRFREAQRGQRLLLSSHCQTPCDDHCRKTHWLGASRFAVARTTSPRAKRKVLQLIAEGRATNQDRAELCISIQDRFQKHRQRLSIKLGHPLMSPAWPASDCKGSYRDEFRVGGDLTARGLRLEFGSEIASDFRAWEKFQSARFRSKPFTAFDFTRVVWPVEGQ